MTTDMFISLVRKYTRARKLTPGCWASWLRRARFEKIDGVWPIPDVTVNTRKGSVKDFSHFGLQPLA